jgi:hypothetical protein
MQTLYKILVFIVLCIGLNELSQSRTHRFRYGELALAYTPPNKQEIPSSDIKTLLSQTYYFLETCERYTAFLASDRATVLKVYKHKEFPLDRFLRKCTIKRNFQILKASLSEKIKNPREIHLPLSEMIKNLERSTSIIRKSSALVYLHTQPTSWNIAKTTIIDPIGISYLLDLNLTCFSIQKAGVRANKHLRSLMQEGNITQIHTVLENLFETLVQTQNRGIFTDFPSLEERFALVEGKVCVWDLELFYAPTNPPAWHLRKMQWLLENEDLSQKLQVCSPTLTDTFDKKLIEGL